jgi:hypothetical protein
MSFGQIKIGNKRKGGISRLPGFSSVDVDRKNPILGNKYILNDYTDDKERAEVIGKYRIDFEADCAANGPMLEETKRIARRVYKGENILLNCWCFGPPTNKPCHVEIIKSKIEEILKPYE